VWQQMAERTLCRRLLLGVHVGARPRMCRKSRCTMLAAMLLAMLVAPARAFEAKIWETNSISNGAMVTNCPGGTPLVRALITTRVRAASGAKLTSPVPVSHAAGARSCCRVGPKGSASTSRTAIPVTMTALVVACTSSPAASRVGGRWRCCSGSPAAGRVVRCPRPSRGPVPSSGCQHSASPSHAPQVTMYQ
jgi:hypothetical protein